MLTRTNGMIGTILGIVVALAGVVFWVATSRHKTGIGLLVIGLIILGAGGYAHVAAGKSERTSWTAHEPLEAPPT
jgi:hypothetical protein